MSQVIQERLPLPDCVFVRNGPQAVIGAAHADLGIGVVLGFEPNDAKLVEHKRVVTLDVQGLLVESLG